MTRPPPDDTPTSDSGETCPKPALTTSDPAAVITRNTRHGHYLFAGYALFYGAFMITTAFAPELLRTRVSGLPLSLVWALSLIASALAVALLYAWLCTRPLR